MYFSLWQKGKQWPVGSEKQTWKQSCKIEAVYLHASLHLPAEQQMWTKVMALLWGKKKQKNNSWNTKNNWHENSTSNYELWFLNLSNL